MQVCTPRALKDLVLVGSVLFVVPLYGPTDSVGPKLGMKVRPDLEILTLSLEYFLDVVQSQLHADDELLMVLVEKVDVLSAVKPAIQDHADLPVTHNAELCHQLPDGFYVGDVTGELSVVEGQPRLFPEEKGEVDLGKIIIFLVSALFHLAEHLGITGDRGDVKGPVLLLDSASALSLEESHPALLIYGLKELAASL